jgi:hypothetical protein
MVTEYDPMLTLQDLFIPVTAWMLAIPVLLYFIIGYIKPSWIQYAVIIYYLEVVFFFFSSIQLFFSKYIPILSHYKFLLPLLLAGCILLYIPVWKKKTPPFKFFLYLNTLLILLLIIECGQLIVTTAPGVNKALSFTNPDKDLPVIPQCDSCTKPDVYFIIFDEYESSTAIKKYWQYDNSALDSFMIDRGFYYVTHSTSNYNFTPFSIGSTLNMDFHQMTFPGEIDMLQYIKGIKSIENNRVCRLFQQQGYTIINHSYFPLPGDEPRQSLSFLSNKREILITPTLYGKLVEDIGWHFNRGNPFANSARMEEEQKNNRANLQQIKNTYKGLLAVAAKPHNTPVFVYAHFMLPHRPYFYDSTGRLTPDSTWYYNTNEKESYLSQLKYTNTLIKNIAVHLQNTGSRPRVIIIQGDHGFRGFPKAMKQLEFNNLNAIYFPDKQYAGLYDRISSINTFRFILHKYFNAPLPLLKDSTVYIRHFIK